MINFPSALNSLKYGQASTSSHPCTVSPGMPLAEPIANGLIKAAAEKLSSTLPKKEADVFDSIVENTVELFKTSAQLLKK